MKNLTIAIAVLLVAISNTAQSADLLSPVTADRLGLVESWHRQLAVPGGATSIVDLQIWVQKNKLREYVEVVQTGGAAGSSEVVFRRIAVDMKNSQGVTMGKAEATRLAKLDVLKLKRRGIEATTRETSLQQVRLYLLGNDGGLTAYDAENGELLWSLRVGNPKLGYASLGITDSYVTVINGSMMYRVIADERPMPNSTAMGGRPLSPVRLDRVPISGATNSDSWVLIPNTRSGIETYSYDDYPGQPGFEIFSGQTIDKPIRYPTSNIVGWTTDQGFFYAMETAGTPTTMFRLKCDGVSAGGPAPASGNRFFFGTSRGRVYGISASRSGEVIWNRSFGEPYFDRPFIAGDHVLISSTYGNLFCLNATDGLPAWSTPVSNVQDVFAWIGNHYFGSSNSGMLTVVSRDSGRPINFGADVYLRNIVMNPVTDRLYLVNDGGTIQCLRPSAGELPTFYFDKSSEAPKVEDAKTPKPAVTENADPFGAAENAEASAPAEAADPFGAGEAMADPFGAGGAGGAEADPFGAPAADAPADDPFAQ